MEKIIKLTPDYLNSVEYLERKTITEKLSGGPKSTRIIMRNCDTGEILGEFHNKVVITGSMMSAGKIFGIKSPVLLPSYNYELELDNSAEPGTVPLNDPVVCLFCVGDSGCGTTSKDVYTSKYIDRVAPENDILPFRYVDATNDLDADLRKYYFGRKTGEDGKISYFFKKFDTEPQLHLRYTDGTQINDRMYEVSTDQAAECFVETTLKINRNDFRDYFEQVRGWDNARISSLSLCYAWYDDTIDDYLWYQDIYPYTKLNFSKQDLVDLTLAIEFQYQIFY